MKTNSEEKQLAYFHWQDECEEDDDVLVDECPPPMSTGILKRDLSIEGCTCGKGVIVEHWVRQEANDDGE